MSDNGSDIRVAGRINLTAEIETVLRTMFSTFSQIAIEAEFGRGFSGSRVFRVRLVESGGRARLPAVVKIAPIGLIRQEWQAYQTWVEHTLPNIARLEVPPVFPTDSLWGGLRYALVGSGTFRVQSLHDYYQQADVDDLCWVLENRLFEIMGPNWWLDNRTNRTFQMRTDYDTVLPVNLLIKPVSTSLKDEVRLVEPGSNLPLLPIRIGDRVQLKGFVVTNVDQERRQLLMNVPPVPEGQPSTSYRLRLNEVPDIARYRVGTVIDSIHGEVITTRHDLLLDLVGQAVGPAVDLSAERLTLSDELSLPNPLLTYQALLQDFLTVNVSTIHGDLNLQNILVDPDTREVSLIDFATVQQGHTLRDLLRLETEVVIMLIPSLLAEAGLPPAAIYPFYQQLHRVTLQPGQVPAANLPHPDLQKPFKMLWVIRRTARKCLFNLDDWGEYYRGLVLHLLGALKFKSLPLMPTAPLPSQVAFWGAAIAQHLLETPPPRQKRRPDRPHLTRITPEIESISEIEPPYGTMRPDSKFYIERAADDRCREYIGRPYATTLFIQAPRQMGKSSLMRKVLDRVRRELNKRSAFIDFQELPRQYFTDTDETNFLIELCLLIGNALEIPEAIDRYWQGRLANISKCGLYLSKYIIPQVNEPFILAMDEVDRMLSSPFRDNFFGMLRVWHNKRAYDEHFAQMTLFLSSSTEPYLFIENPNQSPFNVAELISLQDFTGAEVEELNRRHNLPLSQSQLDDLMALVAGHPFLIRLALYLLVTEKMDLDTLLAQATADTGPFGEHLRYYLQHVLAQPELKQALADICRDHTYEENRNFHRLKGAGLIKKAGQQVVLRNNLYARYFKERLYG